MSHVSGAQNNEPFDAHVMQAVLFQIILENLIYIIGYTSGLVPAPMAHSYRLGLVTFYQVRIPVGSDICHRGCAYTVLQTVQRYGVYSAMVYCAL